MTVPASQLPPPGADDVLFLVDLSNYVFRAYHALPPMQNSKGESTNATLGTLNMLNRMVEDHRPAYLGVAVDSRGKGFRKKMAPDYKANRSAAPPELIQQLIRCREIFEAYNVPILHHEGYEADDVIATQVKRALDENLRVVIASADKDLMQLVVPDRVWLWDAMRNRVYGPPEVEKKFGVPPELVGDALALIGDSSDNIKGVPGIGPKTAAKLLVAYGSLAGIYDNIEAIKQPKMRQKLQDHRADADLARELVTLRQDADITATPQELRYGDHHTERLREIFTELQFTRFVNMLSTADEPAIVADDAPQSPAVHRVCLTEDDLSALAAEVKAAGHVALLSVSPEGTAMERPLTGIAIGTSPERIAYIPLDHRYLGAPKQLDLATVIATLGPVFADSAIEKRGHDLKQSLVVLGNHGFEIDGALFDTMLASYLIDPSQTHKLSIVAEREANMRWSQLQPLGPVGARRAKHDVDEQPIEDVATKACAQVEAVTRLIDVLPKRVEAANVTAVQNDIELPLLTVLIKMERHGVLLDPAPLQKLAQVMVADLASLEAKAHKLIGREFNLASPKQLEGILFDELELKSSKKTKTGRSTDAEALEAIVADHGLPGLVLEHRQIAKLKGTYVDALPKLIHPKTGRIHSSWEQAIAATGRLSSKDPNLQNIPIRSAHGKQIREAFIAPPGYVLMSADYSQIELRVLAHLSQDPKLLEAFTTGQDVHVRTAMEVFDVSADDVTPTMRGQSKTVNFGVIYGMGPVALGKKLGIPRAEAKAFIDAYFEKYAGVRTFMENTLKDARANKTVRTLSGRRRMLPDLASTNRVRRSYAERIAQNTPIQGTAADILKLAMVQIKETTAAGSRMVLTVHDELVFEVPEKRVEEAQANIKKAMEGVLTLDVPLTVEVGWGNNWAEAH